MYPLLRQHLFFYLHIINFKVCIFKRWIHSVGCMTLVTNLKVWIVESIDDVPSEHQELSPLNEQAVEEAEGEEKLLVLELCLASRELCLIDQLVQTLHIRLQTLRKYYM